MFRFEHSEFLYLLLLIPLLWLLHWAYINWKNKSNQQWIDKLSIGRSKYRPFIKLSFFSLAFLFLIIALANPQWGTKRSKVKAKGSDIIIALDISRSMLCEDLAPNRLERAKKFAERLVDKFKGDRIGVVLFAGNAYLQMPLTNDYAAAKLFIRSASTDLASSQGTAIGDAIDLSRNVFGEDDEYHKALIIISDGENHDDEAMTMARDASTEGMLIFFVGVGTPEGGQIPIQHGGRSDYLRDKSGAFVKTTLDEELMRNLADAGQGAYFNIVSRDKILDELDRRIDPIG